MCIFFFKRKTAYEIGTGDWSSDVCSSDLEPPNENFDGVGVAIKILIIKVFDKFGPRNDPVVEIGRASCRERV